MTTLQISVAQPFALTQAIAHLARFPPCGGSQVFTEHSVTRAVDARSVVTVSQPAPDRLSVHLEGPAECARVERQVRNWLSVDDDLTAFYALADCDEPAFAAHVQRHRGLHHVRFFTLTEAVVWFVITQRTPRAVSQGQRRRLIDAYGAQISHAAGVLPVFPSAERLLAAGPEGLGETLKSARKGATLHRVLEGVIALDEHWLRTAPYEFARAALERIVGVGPFTSAAVLLRGLGRMEESPIEMPSFSREAETLYRHFDPRQIRQRYRGMLGYWSWYVKNG